MKIYLDDTRPAPEGWILVTDVHETIQLLKTQKVTDLSLDHDLGNDGLGTGYSVLLWIEENVYTSNYIPPRIQIHTANTSARLRMELAVESINKGIGERR